MPRLILLLAVLLTGTAQLARAQTEYYARVGAVGASNLLRDVIVERISVRQSIAPMLAVGGSLPLGAKAFRANVEATFATGKFHRKETDANVDLGTLRTATVMVGLEGPLGAGLRWRGGLGLIQYWPSEHEGIFLSGGTTRFLAGGGIDFRRPAFANWDLMTSARYDFHRFRTATLEDRGFSQAQAVSRVSLSIGLSRRVP